MPEDNSRRAMLKAKIHEGLGPLNPFEIHLANPREHEWYKKFIDKFIKI